MAIKSAPGVTFNGKYTGTAALKGGEVLKWTAQGTVQVATTFADAIAGVALHGCQAGNVDAQNVGFASTGIVECIASTAITVLAVVSVTAAGEIVTVAANATGVTPFEFIVGIALEAAAAQGDVIHVQLMIAPHSIT